MKGEIPVKLLKRIFIMLAVTVVLAAVFPMARVHADADKTALVNARAEVAAAIVAEDDYWTPSFTAFEADLAALGGLAAVDTLIGDALAVQEDVDAMTTLLQNLIVNLISEAVHNQVYLKYLTARTAVLATYTVRSRGEYADALDIIQAVLEDETRIGDAGVLALEADIDAAILLLEYLADRTALNAALAAAAAINASDGAFYTPSTFAAFQTAYASLLTDLVIPYGKTAPAIGADADASVAEAAAAEAAAQETLALLIPRADKTALNTAYGDADAIELTAFTPSSAAAFTASLILIKAVIDDLEATSGAVSDALAAIATAIELLIPRPDKTALIAAYAIADALDLSGYTPASVAAFDAGMALIAAVIADPDAIATEVATALTDLSDYQSLLVTRAVKTSLLLANNAAILAFYEEKAAYTTSSYEQFRQAVLAYGTYLYVNSVLADANVSQNTVDDLTAIVLAALSQLEVRGDIDALTALYSVAAAADFSSYTPASVATYRAGLVAAATVITDKDTNQAEANAAYSALLMLPTVLIAKADKTALAAIVDDVASLRESAYSISSYQTLLLKVVAATAMIADDDASQASVDAMVQSVAAAITALVRRTTEVVIREATDPIDIDAYVTIGDSTIVGYAVSDPTVLSVDAEGNVTGLKYGSSTVTITLANGIVESIPFVVKAKIKTSTMIYAIVVPFVAAGAGFAMILWNEKTLTFLKKIRFFRNIKKG